ncbi:MAG: hypothetical protein HYW63_03225 [Candidatus Levybacteria bacterium]|nr:hypothetical protein [Candidatus Levybacteria bacterium]
MPQDRQFEERQRESEPSPLISITAVGFEHRFYNIQCLGSVFEQTHVALSANRSARNIVYLEDAGKTVVVADARKRDVEVFGLAGFLVKEAFVAQFRTEPDRTYVAAMVRKIGTEISRGDFSSLPVTSVQNFVLNLGLDDIRTDRYFDVEFEAHTPGAIRNDNKSQERFQRLSAEAISKWESGQFDESLSAYKRAKAVIHASGAARNPEIVQQIRRLVKELANNPQGGNIVLLLGESHLPVIDMLQRQIGNMPSVTFDKKRGKVFADSPEGKLDKAMLSKEQAPDLTYVQSLLLVHAIGELAQMYMASQDMGTFMTNYEDVYKKCAEITERLSIDEIRQLCESRTQIGQYFLRKILPNLR